MAESSSSGSATLREPLKFLPVVFVCIIIGALYGIYMGCHIPLIMAANSNNDAMKEIEDISPLFLLRRLFDDPAVRELVFFNVITLLQTICYLKCILIHPGTIPDKDEDPSWEYVPRDSAPGELSAGLGLQESKRSGERRHCKWCGKFKPDRCHHCRVCKACVLKMDHHCPWIYNCVGFRNHKYFFLLLLYSVIDLIFMIWSMLPSVMNSLDPQTPFARMFSLLFGMTLSLFLTVLLSGFFCFHIWLMIKATTTIEFCEKQLKRVGHDPSAYDRGLYGNVKAVLGENFYTWLLPFDPPAGRGISFLSEETKLSAGMQAAGLNVRRTALQHQFGESGAPSARRLDHHSGGTGSAPSDHSGQEYEDDPGFPK